MLCVTMRYNLVQEKDERPGLEDPILLNDPVKVLNVIFDNFVVEQREDFFACDTTCVIGELGGNLGFFLGGSILALFDVIVNLCSNIFKKLNFRKTLD